MEPLDARGETQKGPGEIQTKTVNTQPTIQLRYTQRATCAYIDVMVIPW